MTRQPIRPPAVVVCLGMGDDTFWQDHGRGPSGARPEFMWEGPATGVECAVCGVLTKHGEVEVEIRYGLDENATPTTYHLHLRCLSILEHERNGR